MSEYQYYEFLAIDQPLTKEQQGKVASMSSRAHVTANKATFITTMVISMEILNN